MQVLDGDLSIHVSMCIFHMPSKIVCYIFNLKMSNMQISFPKKLRGILLLTRKVFLTSWLNRSTWVGLKYFQNKVVGEYCRNKLYLTFVPSSSHFCVKRSLDEMSVPGRLQLMVAVKMRACRRFSWADPEEPDKNLLS